MLCLAKSTVQTILDDNSIHIMPSGNVEYKSRLPSKAVWHGKLQNCKHGSLKNQGPLILCDSWLHVHNPVTAALQQHV